jgi:hypothetical protein
MANLFFVSLFCLINLAYGRKSYIIKEKIESGELKVHQPRVKETAVEWCFFNEENNDWCMNGDETWKIEYFNEYAYETAVQDEVPPNFKHTLSYKSTQSATWDSLFNLERLMTTNTYFSLDEFAFGLRFELYYWIDDYAFCLNLAHFIEPVTF